MICNTVCARKLMGGQLSPSHNIKTIDGKNRKLMSISHKRLEKESKSVKAVQCMRYQ